MNSAVKNFFIRSRRVESNSSPRNFRPLSGPYVPAALAPAPVAAKPRYRVDLSSQQADCEANYFRLRKLLPELSTRESWLFNIGAGNLESQLTITVVDRAPYTTTLEFSQSYGGVVNEALRGPRLTVCMYHDADMAEVVAWEKHRRLQARYDYPNRQMYHVDEKAQLNRFLADWLTLCQAEGHVTLDFAELGLK